MIPPRALATGLGLGSLFSLASCSYLDPASISKGLLPEYDYIVVGGGPSGLVVASRLTEDANVTVLLLEAGVLNAQDAVVTVPWNVGQALGTDADWQLRTTRQEYLDNHVVTFNQGKAIGGGTILNGLVWTRGSAKDYDSWSDLNTVESQTDRYKWRWDDLMPYFQKNENFTTNVDAELQRNLRIHPDPAFHGDAGPLQVAFPHYFYKQSESFLQGMGHMRVPILTEPNNGTGAGATIAPSSMSSSNQSRSDGQTAYLENVVDRVNLHVATEQTVTRILLEQVNNSLSGVGNPAFETLQKAIGVEVAHSTGDVRRNVTCSKEVILAAGAIFSPSLLQVSGIGPKSVLSSLDIPVNVDLPGVGANFQDHGMVAAMYRYTNTSLFTKANVTGDVLAAASDSYYTNRTGPMTAPLISTIAFPAMRHIADDWTDLLSETKNRDVNSTLPSDTPPTVLAGYIAQRKQQLALLRDPTEGAVEIMADSVGTLTVAMQRPMSRGTVRPSSADIFDAPLVDPRYCSEPFDCLVLARALLFNCALIQTPSMAALQPIVEEPMFCPANMSSFDRAGVNTRLLELVKANLTTEFHPTGTTAMMPLAMGGVVDTELRVYGTANLRVVDAGVMPMVLGAHLQAVVYAIAERAADIIKNDYYGSVPSTAAGGASGTPKAAREGVSKGIIHKAPGRSIRNDHRQ